MFKIDKSTWEQMSSNKEKIVKQWVPAPHETAVKEVKEPAPDNSATNIIKLRQEKRELTANKQQILNKAKDDAERIKKDAFQEGYSQGINTAKKKLSELTKIQSLQFDAAINELEAIKTSLNNEIEDKSLKLAVIIAEKILNLKLENDDKVFEGLVRSTLSTMDDDEKYIIHVSSNEYKKHFKNKCDNLQEELQCEAPISVVSDSSLKQGDCIIESEDSYVDASVDTQLNKIADSLSQRDNQYHEVL